MKLKAIRPVSIETGTGVVAFQQDEVKDVTFTSDLFKDIALSSGTLAVVAGKVETPAPKVVKEEVDMNLNVGPQSETPVHVAPPKRGSSKKK